MKKFSTLLSVILFVTIAGHSQKNLQPGYIINNSNDTVSGFIDYREWYKNPVSILFTQSKDEVTQKFRIADISGFDITGKEQYRRHVVTMSMGKDIIADIDGKDTSQTTDTVFLKVLHKGSNVQLFSYSDDIKSRLYILVSGETTPLELKNSRYQLNGQFVSEKEYRSVLFGIAKKYYPENMELQTRIYRTEYFNNDILAICYELNGIGKDSTSRDIKEEKSPYRFWAGAGINSGQVNIEGENVFAGKTSGASLSPLFAAGIDIFVNPHVGRMFLRTTVSYSSSKTEAYFFEKYFASQENYYLKFKQVNIAVHEILNYNLYNGKSFKYFIGAGAGFNFSSYPLNERTFIREATTGTTTTVNNNYLEFVKKGWLNLIVQTGFSVSNLEVSVAYLPKTSISNYLAFEVNNSSLRLQVNYLFKK